MGFPTTAVLDSFDRENEDPLSDSGNWGGLIWPSGPDGGYSPPRMELVSDAAVAAASPTVYASAYWKTACSGAVEVWGRVNGYNSGPFVACNYSNPGTDSPTGYFLQALAYEGGGVALFRQDPDEIVSLATLGESDFTDGGLLGMSVVNGVISVYTQDGLQGTVGDNTYTRGYLGIGYGESADDGAGFTAFGGGASAADSIPQFPQVSTQSGLFLQVTDLQGNPISGDGHPMPIRTYTSAQVVIPLSAGRSGSFDMSFYEKVVADLNVAEAVVKVFYRNPKGTMQLVLQGIVLNKTDDFDSAVTSVNLIDSTVRLQRRYLGYNHYSVMLTFGEQISDGDVNALTGGDFDGVESIYGLPLDGTGLRLLLLDASHGAMDWRGWPVATNAQFLDVPAMGIRYEPGVNSVDNANRQPLYNDEGVPPAGIPPNDPTADYSSSDYISATVTEGSYDLTDVVMPSGYTLDDVVEYYWITGDGIADFAQVESVSTADDNTITMTQAATASGSDVQITLEGSVYATPSRGDCVYDDWTDMVQAQGGLECDFIPVDADYNGPSGATWYPGQLCELYTANRVGSDRSQGNAEGNTPLVFVHGIGGFHLTHAPDADSLITYEVQVAPGGPNDPLDMFSKVTVIANTVETYGVWEDWEQATSAGDGDDPISNQVLLNRAAAILTAYQSPPQFCTATIDTDAVGAACYGSDFYLGDTVTVYGKKGYVTVGPVAMRITQITISQADQDGNCQLGLTLVPYLTATVDPTEEDY